LTFTGFGEPSFQPEQPAFRACIGGGCGSGEQLGSSKAKTEKRLQFESTLPSRRSPFQFDSECRVSDEWVGI